MTIQVGHPHECPTFFCAPSHGEVNESTGQQVNKLVSDRSDKSDLSDAHKCKSPLAPKICVICSVYQSQYQLDTISQTERTVPLVCFFGLVWVIIKSGVGVAYFKKLSYFCDSFLDDSMLFGLLLKC